MLVLLNTYAVKSFSLRKYCHDNHVHDDRMQTAAVHVQQEREKNNSPKS